MSTQTLRLRQAVVAAADRDSVVAQWASALGTTNGYNDPGVGEFGLNNAVVAVGDSFLEVVSPLVAGSSCAAQRHMDRHGGDCGYMAIFQVADLNETRDHLRSLGLRTVWNADLAQISGTHVHPADIGGAIVSFDQARPPESWHWAGPDWAQAPASATTGLAGIRMALPDPAKALEIWAAALGLIPVTGALVLPDNSRIDFDAVGSDGRQGLVGIDLWAAENSATKSFTASGVEFRLLSR